MAGRFGHSKSKRAKIKRTQSTGRFALESHSRDVDDASFGLSASEISFKLADSATNQPLSDYSSLISLKDLAPGRVKKIPRKDLERDLTVRIMILSETQKQLCETENELKETRRLLEREQYKREIAELQREAGKLNIKSLESLPRRIREMLDNCVQKVVIQGESKTVNLQVGENNLITTPLFEEANDVITRIRDVFKNYGMTLEANHRMERQMEEMREAFRELPTSLSQQLFHRDRKLLQILTSDKSDKKVISEGLEELKRWFINKKDQNDFPWLTEAAIMRLVNKFESLNIYCTHFADILHIDLSDLQIDGNSKLDENSCKTVLVHWIRQPVNVEVADILRSIDELESQFATQLKEKEYTARAFPEMKEQISSTEQTRSDNAAVTRVFIEKEILIEEVRESLKQLQNRLSDQLTLRDKNIIYMMTANLPERHIIIDGLEQLKRWSEDQNNMEEIPWFTKAAITRLVNKFESLNCSCKQLADVLHMDLSALQIDGFLKLDETLCKTLLVHWSQQTETVKAADVMNSLEELDSRFDKQTKTKYVDKTTLKEQELHADAIKHSSAAGLPTKTCDTTDSLTMAYLDTILKTTTDTLAMLHNIYEK